jgi:hypothetical protein
LYSYLRNSHQCYNTGGSASYYSISPAIRNGLSFNKKTGTISGAPIVASDSVTYVETANGFKAFKEVEKMVTARSLVSLFSVFFIFKNND